MQVVHFRDYRIGKEVHDIIRFQPGAQIAGDGCHLAANRVLERLARGELPDHLMDEPAFVFPQETDC